MKGNKTSVEGGDKCDERSLFNSDLMVIKHSQERTNELLLSSRQ